MNMQHDVKNIELTELNDSEEHGKPLFSTSIELVKNVKVDLAVTLGDSELTVDELFNLKSGSVIKLNKEIDTPVDIELDGKVIARGIIVAVDDNYGVKITEISQQ